MSEGQGIAVSPVGRGFCLPAAVAMLLTACAAGPDYHPGTAGMQIPGSYATPVDAEPPAALANWWTVFGDTELTRLVDAGMAGNLDIAQAAARLRAARESLVQSRAALFPTLNASARGGRNFESGGADSTSLSVGADASWEVDLFGEISRGVEAAHADYQAAGFDLEDVRTAIAAEIARNYLDLRAAEASLAIARETLASQQENLEIAGWRVQAGLVSSLDEEQARAQRAQTAASIPALEQGRAAAAYRLGVLTGRAPGALLAELAHPDGIPRGPATVSAGIPADTLRQRPDVRAAERGLAAASARIGVARARLFPALSISGNVGSSALSLGGLGDVITGGLFAAISQIVFDGGRRQSNVRAAEAAADAALASYRQTVLSALEDVENALAARRAAQQRQKEFVVAYDAANTAAILARSQYRAGLTDFQTLLEAERQLLGARDGLSRARADDSQALASLYLALGGGWTPLPVSETSP